MKIVDDVEEVTASINAIRDEMVVDAKYAGSPTDEVMRFEGTIASTDGSESIPLTFDLPLQDIQKLGYREEEGSIVLLDPEGNETSYRVEEYSFSEDTDTQTRSQSGTLVDYSESDSGERTVVSMNDDPVTVPVQVIYLAGGFTAGCLIKTYIEEYFATNRLKELVDGCKSSGGLPQHSIDATWGFSWNPPKIGCNFKLNFECKR